MKAKVSRPADQTRFTNEDVNKVEIYLDNILQEKGSTSEFTGSSLLFYGVFTGRYSMVC